MSILDSLPGIVASATAGLTRVMALVVPGEQTSDGQGGWIPGTPVEHPCRGIVDSYSDMARGVGAIPGSDRKIIIMAGTLPTGVKPKTGDKISAEGRLFTIIVADRDPAAATWECQAR